MHHLVLAELARDHQARLRAEAARHLTLATATPRPGRIRTTLGRTLVTLGQRLQGASLTAAEPATRRI